MKGVSQKMMPQTQVFPIDQDWGQMIFASDDDFDEPKNQVQKPPPPPARTEKPIRAMSGQVNSAVTANSTPKRTQTPKTSPFPEVKRSAMEILQIERLIEDPEWIIQDSQSFNDLMQDTIDSFNHPLIFQD